MWWVVLLVGFSTGGCHIVFSLEASTCWSSQLIERDDDGDGVEDGCDNCPADANRDQASSDGDLVGDLCDPRPEDPGDRIVFFDSFVAPDPIWQPFGTGTWSVADTAQQSLLVQDGTFVLDLEFDNATVQTSFTGQTPAAPPGTPSIVGVYVRIPPGQETSLPVPGVLCHAYRKDSTNVLKVEGAPEATPSDDEPLEDGAQVRLQLSSLGRCVGARDQLAPHTVEIPLTKASGKVGFYTHNSTAKFEWITVIQSP
ncbi:MAG TPA: thrombospondin type 3 repeat-containing protein [Kofleriaceae bacterium]